ncbi:sel1 repeat family protein [Streptomyces sp. TR1341]|uniref:TPR repeat protein n=1 Tax=Streptomyces murinus TaxID=33900 RepID=A0A7W3NMS9_STRMR|nr:MULTISPECIES: tetratricopeptide repeat protein [Streptomyces]MBA9053331.1 TPR repeat protein [Streptomyces murinus]NDK27877.1 sel1 repeat family protein [Streptomyces sp. TR1341]UWW94472.1 sel1 repeat family protein [Streptomyces murinus]
MGEAVPSWRVFPEGVPVQELLKSGDQAAEAGDLISAGNWYFHAKRRGSVEGRDKARRLQPRLEVLAEQGDFDAKVLVAGLLLERGEQAPRAVALLESAAGAAVVEGVRELGFVLAAGIGVASDPVRANGLYRAAAEAGDGYAAFNLAVNFYRGHGTEKSFREFSKWLQVAGDLGIPEACAVLGDQCAKKGLDGESLQWYVRAARSSHVPAMFVAAQRYRDGIGTVADPVQAVRWFLAPLDRGNGDGIHDAIELASSMTDEQIREAGRLSGHSDEAELLVRRRY